jgi:hypothetical protein
MAMKNVIKSIAKHIERCTLQLQIVPHILTTDIL